MTDDDRMRASLKEIWEDASVVQMTLEQVEHLNQALKIIIEHGALEGPTREAVTALVGRASVLIKEAHESAGRVFDLAIDLEREG